MTINTERLKTDAAYWDECGAPEWATVVLSHYSGGGMCFASKFEHNAKAAIVSEPDEVFNLADDCWKDPIPRPQSEWVDVLPPVGRECEVRMHGSKWSKARVVGHDEEGGIPAAVCRVLDSYYAFSSKCIRPIPTKAQRDRDELADLIAYNIHIEMQDGNFNVEVGEAVDAAISAGWTKP